MSKILLGLDEVGRGPWAGPLVVGAVILGPNFNPEIRAELTDSKKLSPKKRTALSASILDQAAATGLGWVSSAEIDRYSLGSALKLAARRAVKPILDTCRDQQLRFDEIIIDGTINLLDDTPLADRVTILKKADFLVKEVSAASIIAKVARDHYMADLAVKYPGYSFEKHVGYGTAAHTEALQTLGPCPEHRRSFRPIQNLLTTSASPSAESAAHTVVKEPTTSSQPTAANFGQTSKTSTTAIGQAAEIVIADYLEAHGHTIIARNYKTKTYEIDIVSQSAQTLYFTEVKYRKTANRGDGLANITPSKLAQMRYAATAFLTSHPTFKHHSAKLAAAAVSGVDFTFQDWIVLDGF